MKKTIFFIDPNSYFNMRFYDESLLNNMNFENAEVTLFGNILFDGILNKNIKTKLIYSYNTKSGIRKIISYLQTQIILFYNILRYKPNVIHIQYVKVYQFDWLLLKTIAFFCRGTKIVYTAHNILPHDTGKRFYAIFKKIYNTVDVIIVHTKPTKKTLTSEFEINPDKIYVIPHGLLNHCVKQNDVNDKKQLIRKNLNNNLLTYLFVGKINNYKGIDILLEGWQLLPDEYKKRAQLVIAGLGKIPDTNINMEANNIKLFAYEDFMSNEEFIGYIQLSDVVLLPYKKISQSGVLLTVLYEKKPIIVSPIEGLIEPFEFGNTGWIMKDISSIELKNSIMNSIDDLQNNKFTVTEETWNNIENYYSWKNISLATQKIYNQ
ncbi:MAG: glycosyltransferase [Paludibacter sp.]|nr:glycosyltransferase [Paludibacter sp.]